MDRDRHAYHEAGHVVALYLFDGMVESISSMPGREFHPDRALWPNRETIAQDELIVVLYAGGLSQGRYEREAGKESHEEEWLTDFEIAADLAGKRHIGIDPSLINRADQLVEDRWREVQAVAACLMLCGLLDDFEIRNVIDAATDGEVGGDRLYRIWHNGHQTKPELEAVRMKWLTYPYARDRGLQWPEYRKLRGLPELQDGLIE